MDPQIAEDRLEEYDTFMTLTSQRPGSARLFGR